MEGITSTGLPKKVSSPHRDNIAENVPPLPTPSSSGALELLQPRPVVEPRFFPPTTPQKHTAKQKNQTEYVQRWIPNSLSFFTVIQLHSLIPLFN